MYISGQDAIEQGRELILAAEITVASWPRHAGLQRIDVHLKAIFPDAAGTLHLFSHAACILCTIICQIANALILKLQKGRNLHKVVEMCFSISNETSAQSVLYSVRKQQKDNQRRGNCRHERRFC